MHPFVQRLLFGLGFAISLTGLGALSVFAISSASRDLMANMQGDMVEDVMHEMRSVEGIKVLSHERHERGKDVVVLGKIKNEGKSARSSYAIEVELFNGDEFVDLCRESYYSGIAPGEERHFKVTCHACRGSSVPAHSRYDIRVTE